MSRIPPHLVRVTPHCCLEQRGSSKPGLRVESVLQKPHKLRNMLADFGDIERLYLAPEGKSLLALNSSCQACLALWPAELLRRS